MDDVDFSALYTQHSRDVYRFALYLCGDASLAQDLTAETFARAWIGRERIRVGTVKAYLLMIARNLYRDVRRRPVNIALAADFEAADPAASPETSAHARGELQRVLSALRQLPDTDREVLLMASVEGLSHHDIAVALGLSADAVKVRVHRARVRLNAVLDGGGPSS